MKLSFAACKAQLPQNHSQGLYDFSAVENSSLARPMSKQFMFSGWSMYLRLYDDAGTWDFPGINLTLFACKLFCPLPLLAQVEKRLSKDLNVPKIAT